MAILKAARSAQFKLTASFAFTFSDTMLDITAASKDFGLTNIAATSFDIINMPVGSIVTGGSIVRTTAFDTASFAVIVGDSVDADRYFATADVKAVGVSALLAPGYKNVGGLPIRVQITNADVCTTGVGLLVVDFIVDGRANEAYPT